MDAREYFENVRDAAKCIKSIGERKDEMMEAMGPRGMTYDAHGQGMSDPMRRVDDLVDWERQQIEELGECRRQIEDAWQIVAGIEETFKDDAAQVVTRYSLWCEGWEQIAQEMGHKASECRLLFETTMDWCDYVGLARLREAGRAAP